MVPGWPYSFVAALKSGSTSWRALLDARRLEPGAYTAAVTAAQLRGPTQHLQRRALEDGRPAGPDRGGRQLRRPSPGPSPAGLARPDRAGRVFFNPVPDDYRMGPKGGQPAFTKPGSVRCGKPNLVRAVAGDHLDGGSGAAVGMRERLLGSDAVTTPARPRKPVARSVEQYPCVCVHCGHPWV